MEKKAYVETQQEKCWLERSEVWKICLRRKRQSCLQVKQGRIQSLSLGGRSPCRAPLPTPHSSPPSLPCPFPSLPSLPYASPLPFPFPSLSFPYPPLPLKRGVRGYSPGKFGNSRLL